MDTTRVPPYTPVFPFQDGQETWDIGAVVGPIKMELIINN